MPGPDPLRDLGVRLRDGGGEVRVWSGSATAVELCMFGDGTVDTVALDRDDDGVWSGRSERLAPGVRYSLRAAGPESPRHRFDPAQHLIDPYARGVERTDDGWRGVVSHDGFDWGGVRKPGIPLADTVLYEAHAKGLTAASPHLPERLRGTYAGLAHESTIAHLTGLGVTAVELLPVHAFTSERRLLEHGLRNYWGYNTLNFFSPHPAYATAAARAEGASGVLREFKGMVRLLHEAGLEVVLDVVYNHTAEEGPDGPTSSLRGLDPDYYRRLPDGAYIDVTGCGNTVDLSHPVAQRLVLDSLRYWAREVQVDGFRFDLAPVLGRDGRAHFDPAHPLLEAIVSDPDLADVKAIAEPWDVGAGGWQVGAFPHGWSEWNDGYRDRVRDFWLGDAAHERAHGTARPGLGALAQALSGSAEVFRHGRAPLASVNFVTAHDGFTLADLTAYDRKHNEANGEDGRDGTDDNHSWNHGAEGPTDDPAVLEARRRTMRTLLGTLLLSAGVPMLTAGDETGRTQAGNNNAYCHDDERVWMSWEREPWQEELRSTTARLIALRRQYAALRPARIGTRDDAGPGLTCAEWFTATGLPMAEHDWTAPGRTLQYLATAEGSDGGEPSRILLVVHGGARPAPVVLPEAEGVVSYTLLWDSAADDAAYGSTAPGDEREVAALSVRLYRAQG